MTHIKARECVECGAHFVPHYNIDREESCNLCRIAESLRRIADAAETHWR